MRLLFFPDAPPTNIWYMVTFQKSFSASFLKSLSSVGHKCNGWASFINPCKLLLLVGQLADGLRCVSVHVSLQLQLARG